MARILIVEDYLDLKDFLTLLLQLSNYEVRSVASKKELFTALESFTPDVILLDVMLGGDNGRDICRELKQKDNAAHIILLSANPKVLVDHEECHADAIIEKPFNNTDVLNKIQEAIGATGKRA